MARELLPSGLLNRDALLGPCTPGSLILPLFVCSLPDSRGLAVSAMRYLVTFVDLL